MRRASAYYKIQSMCGVVCVSVVVGWCCVGVRVCVAVRDKIRITLWKWSTRRANVYYKFKVCVPTINNPPHATLTTIVPVYSHLRAKRSDRHITYAKSAALRRACSLHSTNAYYTVTRASVRHALLLALWYRLQSSLRVAFLTIGLPVTILVSWRMWERNVNYHTVNLLF